jgi:predicted PurR-regulated permease PerM
MVLERKEIGEFALDLAPKNIEMYLKKNYEKIQGVFTAWIKAMFILSISIFFTTYVGLHIAEWI